MSLYPTKTRLALLERVAQGDVLEGITDNTEGETWLTDMDGSVPQKVTARIAELERAGWVRLPDDPPVVWRLTDAGRAVLAAADGS